ncbi:MAG: NAD-dependent epimerase/dehydratase family protein [Nitrosarchaeum sp.]|nr:NAD-dependent epimerase/dehydratase family protein [Nitrosarchaeum sp.]
MKVLLVGGLGFIGKRFIQKFSKKYELSVYANKNSIRNVDKDLLKDVRIQEGSIEEELSNFIKKIEPKIIIHLAAMTGLKKCEENPEKAFQTNVYGTFNIIKSCVDVHAKLVFASSFEVYGRTDKYERLENDILNPVNTYSITKMLGEELIKHANRMHGLDYTILRISNVYGPGYQRGINSMIKTAINEKKIFINDPKRFRNFIYVDDVVELLDIIINDNNASNQIFNVGSKYTLSLEEVAKKISSYLNFDVKLEFMPGNKFETDYRPNLEKSNRHNYYAKTTFDEGLKNTIKWYTDNQKY